MEIGIFGITANPIHLGHIRVINNTTEKLDEVWVTPVFQHPFGKKFIDYEHRLNMLHIALKANNNPKAVIKELDKQFHMEYNKVSYSYDLLSYLKSQYPEHNFSLIIGEDNFKPEVWTKFYRYKDLEKEFGIVIVKDEGVHSTQIRELLKENKDVSDLVGVDVAQYLLQHKLY